MSEIEEKKAEELEEGMDKPSLPLNEEPLENKDKHSYLGWILFFSIVGGLMIFSLIMIIVFKQ